MRRDYHMHPKAWADEERFDAFVSEALRKDIKEICVTDHMPLSISNASDRIIKGRVGITAAVSVSFPRNTRTE